MDSNMKREIILDNYSHPYNRGTDNTEGYFKVNSNNESCIDNIDLYIKFKDDLIDDIKFDGEACAISTASTSIMIKNMIGKSIDEVLTYIKNFEAMLNEESYEDIDFNEAVVFDETYKQGNRKTCVTLPYTGIKKAIEGYKKSLD
ncbi:MAG: SUF system NifU family Fe-S cluster assembly protein [Erysipelotrichales bacterium]|nr:SUF system NifU family Fe-S cluster assembly protein [Erysipelotrichales bacterium]